MAGERTVFERRPGELSGRIIPHGATAPEGEYVFCLGSDMPGYVAQLASGDGAKVERVGHVDVDAVAIAHVRIETRAAPANGGNWSVYGYDLTGAKVFLGGFFPFPPGTIIDMDDFALPMDAGDRKLGFGLEMSGPGDSSIDVELPGVWIDNITIDVLPQGVEVFNRYPANGMVSVPRNTPIIFYLIGNTGLPDIDVTNVTVNGVAAMIAGVGQPGFSVSNGAPAPRMLAVIIQPDDPFDSEEVVTVNVTTIYNSMLLDRTWSFVCVDETAPRIITASASEHSKIRVVWDEPVKMTDHTASDDAMNPSNWTVTPQKVPAVTLEVVSVAALSASEVELTLNIPMTQGAAYEIVVENVEDLLGNVVVAPYDRYTIQGYVCTDVERRRFSMWWMLSDMDRRRDETGDLELFLSVLQEPLDQIVCDIDRWTDILDVDIAEERYLDQMLITLGNPFTFVLSIEDKRRLIRTLVRMYQQKGTAIGIINVVRFFLGIEIEITAYNQDGWLLGVHELGWDNYLASSESFARYSFIVISPVILTDEQRTWMRALIVYMKPAHTHLIELREPEVPENIDHLELGLSELGSDDAPWMLH
jgi:phage tail-like protein